MPFIRALFCRSHHPSSYALSVAMMCKWSHVAPIIEDELNVVIDATYMNGGVQRRALKDVIGQSIETDIREFSCPDPTAAYNFARSQIGRPYDFKGVLGVGLQRDWQKDDAWFCSEFLEAMLTAGGNQRFVRNIHRVTVAHSYMVR